MLLLKIHNSIEISKKMWYNKKRYSLSFLLYTFYAEISTVFRFIFIFSLKGAKK